MTMRVTYAIGVCTEARELDDLLHYLLRVEKVLESGDDVNVLVDSKNVTVDVRAVLSKYGGDISMYERAFDGDFSEHRNFHIEKCSGEMIFMLDADEIPQSSLIQGVRGIDSDVDIVYVPRMNIVPGYTPAWLDKHKFQVNNTGWINWPDYQGRIFRNSRGIQWKGSVHEKLCGSEKVRALAADPKLALWHIKSLRKQDSQNACYDELVGKTP